MTQVAPLSKTAATPSPWHGLVPFEDTALAVTDTGGAGRPIVYLNGAYADARPWKPVIARLGSGFRHITYDERARGKSQRSGDYSFEGTVRDLGAVLKARGVERPILVGWSYGAFTALHYADRFPEQVAGIVAVDGGTPFGLTGEAGHERIRKLFHRMRLLIPLVGWLGLSARMTVEQHADVNIELNETAAALTPLLDRASRPVRYVLATGGNIGSSQEEMEQVRASLDPVLTRNPTIEISVKVPANHGSILKKGFKAVADTVRELARITGPEASVRR